MHTVAMDQSSAVAPSSGRGPRSRTSCRTTPRRAPRDPGGRGTDERPRRRHACQTAAMSEWDATRPDHVPPDPDPDPGLEPGPDDDLVIKSATEPPLPPEQPPPTEAIPPVPPPEPALPPTTAMPPTAVAAGAGAGGA